MLWLNFPNLGKKLHTMLGPHIETAGEQLKKLNLAVEGDATIPTAHKSILNKIISFLLKVLPSVVDLFTGADGEVVPEMAGEIPHPVVVTNSSAAHDAVSEHPIVASLGKAVSTASADATTANKGVLDKIFSFILKILPTVLGLFSGAPLSPASASPPQSSGASGNVGGASGNGQTLGASVNTGAAAPGVGSGTPGAAAAGEGTI